MITVPIYTEIGWQGAITAIVQLTERIRNESPRQFAEYDAERLEAAARVIREAL